MEQLKDECRDLIMYNHRQKEQEHTERLHLQAGSFVQEYALSLYISHL